MSKKALALAAVLMTAAMTLAACGSGTANTAGGATKQSDMKFVNVVKVSSAAWFENMNKGVTAFGEETGVQVSQTGPQQASAEGQVSIVQNLIPQKPTVIGVDPNSQESLEGVLGRAKQAGIMVVSQEAPQLKNTDFNLEAFSNEKYGAEMMDSLATCMGGKGQYVTFVGQLTAAPHMAWAQAELAESKKYPNISRVTDPVVSNEDSSVAYQKAKELLAKYPNLKGFIGSASTGIPGIAKAVTELGLAGKVCIVGTSVPSLTKQYVMNGTIDSVFLWDSAKSGQAVMNGALMMLKGTKIKSGTDLGVPGYTHIVPCGAGATPQCFQGDAILHLDKSNIDQYNF